MTSVIQVTTMQYLCHNINLLSQLNGSNDSVILTDDDEFDDDILAGNRAIGKCRAKHQG